MFQLKPIKPPLGGPELECSLAYRELKLTDLRKFAPIIFDNGFSLDVERIFGSKDPEELDPPGLSGVQSLDDVVYGAAAAHYSQLTVCFTGKLAGLKMGLALTLRTDCGVVTISVPEDMLWAFSGDPTQAELPRLKAFTRVCQDLANANPPAFAHLDTEGVNPEELTVVKSELVKGLGPYDPRLFDDEDTLERLLAWYTEHNPQQWQHWT